MPKPHTKPAAETKSAAIRRLLARKAGADAQALQKATGWQPHSVRAAISTLRNTAHQIERTSGGFRGRGARYRIVAAPERTS